jgi:hypothetical protein
MLTPNLLVDALAALIPLVIGMIWYHPKVFGTVWMRVSGVNMEDGKKPNMALIFGLTYVFSFFIALAMNAIVIHQFHIASVLMGEPNFMEAGSEANNYMVDFMTRYGDRFRTFKHGAFHGTLAGILIATPVVAINGMFEKKGAKYILINSFYFIVSMALVGGVVCALT